MKVFLTYIFLLLISLTIFSCTEKADEKNSGQTQTKASWPIFRGDNNLSGFTSEQLPDNPALLWTFDSGSEIVSSAVMDSASVFIGALDGKMYSLNIQDGQKKWEFDSGDEIEASALLVKNTIYFGNLTGDFFAINSTDAKLLWKGSLKSAIHGSANCERLEDGRLLILVGGYNNKMHCFDAEKGTLLWAFETDGYINGAPAVYENKAAFGGCDEKLHVLSVTDGEKAAVINAGSYVPGSPALLGGTAYLGHFNNEVMSININTEQINWKFKDGKNKGPFFSSPAVSKDRLVIGSRNGLIYCLDRTSGKKIWTFRTQDEVDSSPVIAHDKVISGSADGRLYILDLESGEKIWHYEIGAEIIGCPAVSAGMIIIGADDGRLYAFGEKK